MPWIRPSFFGRPPERTIQQRFSPSGNSGGMASAVRKIWRRRGVVSTKAWLWISVWLKRARGSLSVLPRIMSPTMLSDQQERSSNPLQGKTTPPVLMQNTKWDVLFLSTRTTIRPHLSGFHQHIFRRSNSNPKTATETVPLRHTVPWCVVSF